jgi:hypothetical protein
MATLWYDGQSYFVADSDVRQRKIQIARALAKGEPAWLRLGEVELLISPGIAFTIRWEGTTAVDDDTVTTPQSETPAVSEAAAPDGEQ